jgi:hypothetical protein
MLECSFKRIKIVSNYRKQTYEKNSYYRRSRLYRVSHTGYIGSHIAVSLANNGYIPILIDNLLNSHESTIKKLNSIIKKKVVFYKADLNNKLKLDSIFKQHFMELFIAQH